MTAKIRLGGDEFRMKDVIDNDELFEQLTSKVEDLTRGNIPTAEALGAICDMLKEMVLHYDWVGFYLVDKASPKELVLGPYAGEPTDHVRIPFGKGICGQAAETEETFIVQDVTAETNYLSCSINVKAEIVVPIFKNGAIIGELDIDSHAQSPFTERDESFLKKVADLSARIL